MTKLLFIPLKAGGSDSVVEALAKNEIMLQHIAKNGGYIPGCGMDPDDDFYTRPYAFINGFTSERPKTALCAPTRVEIKYVVFRAGKVRVDDVLTRFQVRSAHDDAIIDMPHALSHGMCADGSVEEIMDELYEPTLVLFQENETDKEKSDFENLKLIEDRAMELMCKALNVAMPADWRSRRDAFVEEHRVWASFTEDQPNSLTGRIKGYTKDLDKCLCGNYAKPGEDKCNGCL